MSFKVENINDIMCRLHETYVKTHHPLGNDISEVLDYVVQLQFDLDYAKAKLDGTWPDCDPYQIGHLTVTWAGDEIVMVSRQDDEHRILKVIAEKGNPPGEKK